MIVKEASAASRAFRDEAIELLRKHAGHLDAKDMLALASQMVGQIIALQDHRTVTREMALKILMANVEQGNRDVIENLMASRGEG